MSSMIPQVAKFTARRVQVEARLNWLRKLRHRHEEAILCRATGIAIMLGLLWTPNQFSPAARTIRRSYIFRYWRTANVGEWLDIVFAVLAWPIGIVVCALWYTRKNGALIAGRGGPSRFRQFADQLRLAATSGLLPAWYYIFELHEPGATDRARGYLTRGETKHGAYQLLAKARCSCSPLSDKERFAVFCAERQVNAIPVLFSAHDGKLRSGIRQGPQVPETDLFIKPVRGRGGRGAERWDHAGGGFYVSMNGEALCAEQFLDRLIAMSRSQPYLVQERARNHPEMCDLTNGALSTIRMISCLDENEEPELIGAVLRMAVGSNVTVDNVHAGGLAAAVDLASGELWRATDMGFDSRMGWIDRHPHTGGPVTGRVLPLWDDVCSLVRRAHGAFQDWVVVGWDVAITADGARLVEGNSGPDIDLIQRPLRTTFGDGRLGELIAFHLKHSERAWRH